MKDRILGAGGRFRVVSPYTNEVWSRLVGTDSWKQENHGEQYSICESWDTGTQPLVLLLS